MTTVSDIVTDSVSLKQLAELHEHVLAVYSIAFHPSAPLMASGLAIE